MPKPRGTDVVASTTITLTIYSENPTLDEIKRAAVVDRLEQWDQDKAGAAASLGISLKTLYNMLHRWNMMPPLKKHAR